MPYELQVILTDEVGFMEIDPVKPDFLIIGAQKCGTTWLWHILDQHPGTDLKNKKEIQYFSSSKNYHKGLKWY